MAVLLSLNGWVLSVASTVAASCPLLNSHGNGVQQHSSQASGDSRHGRIGNQLWAVSDLDLVWRSAVAGAGFVRLVLALRRWWNSSPLGVLLVVSKNKLGSAQP